VNFANIRNNEILDFNSKYVDKDIIRIETTEEMLNAYIEDKNKVVYKNGQIVLNENYEQEQQEKERERVNGLKCTKRVFALMLQEVGIDYLTMLKPLIESNPQAQLEWELCVELERGNPLLDVMAKQLNVSSDKLDAIFKLANNEITQEEFVQAITPQEETEDEIQEEAEEIEEEVEEVVE
jgi:hypothetical protein